MKRVILITTMLLLSFMALGGMSGDKLRIFIPMHKSNTDVGKVRPRTMHFVPFQCFYDTMNCAVYIEPLSDVGEVSVTVENNFTGEMKYTNFDASEGLAMVPISGSEGNYTITLTTEFDEVFEGYFMIP